MLSNSTMAGGEYLRWAFEPIRRFLGPIREALFIPYAAVSGDYDAGCAKAAAVLADMNVGLKSIHRMPAPLAVLRNAEAVLIGGGNTFRLAERLQVLGLFDELKRSAETGTPIVGWSAGAVIACPSIRTTNDMPVVVPASFAGLGLVPFQINPHFTDRTIPDFAGETRIERLQEYVALNADVYVVGLREGNYLEVTDTHLCHEGKGNLEVFHAALGHRSLPVGSDLRFLGSPVNFRQT